MEYDIRVITFKKVELPQTERLQVLLENERNSFISFQNYHLIDIQRAIIENGCTAWEKIYACISSCRQNDESDTRICQSMVVFGPKTEFWNNSPELMFISMIKTSNTDGVSYCEIEAIVSEAFRKSGIPKNKWCLYCSMDFCDYLLVTRDITLSQMRETLWIISSTSKDGCIRIIRDISTQIVLSRRKVQQLFDEFTANGNRYVPATLRISSEDTFELSIDASLQGYQGLKEFVDALRGYCDSGIISNVRERKIFGHHDICITISNCTIDFMVFVAFLLNRMVCSDASNTIGVFELNPAICADLSITIQPKIASDYMLFSIVKEKMLPLAKQLSEDPVFSDGGCIYEITKSLLLLLKGGFTEEFALCIIEPLAGYIDIARKEIKAYQESIQAATYEANKSAAERIRRQAESRAHQIGPMLRSFTKGISLLVQTIMHNDGEFVHAPSFQTRLFDVPPKLLALYEILAHKIAEFLTDSIEQENNQRFYFLFNPDFRKDIYVDRITSTDGVMSSISIINMNERMLYNPDVVITLLSHEIAHSVGSLSRNRPVRVSKILTSIASIFIRLLFPVAANDPNRDAKNRLWEIFSRSFGNAIASYYKETTPIPEPHCYYISQIRSYLEQTNYFVGEVRECNDNESKFASIVIENWSATIQNLDQDTRELFFKQCEKWLTTDSICLTWKISPSLASKIGATYLLSKLNEKIILEFDESINNQFGWFAWFKMNCEMIIDAFQESYADLCMIKHLGISDFSHYQRCRGLITQSVEKNPQKVKAYSAFLRTEAIYAYIEGAINPDLEKQFVRFDEVAVALKQLVEYLEACDFSQLKGSEYMREIKRQMAELNPYTLSDFMREQMLSYRKELRNVVCDALEDDAI